MTDRSILRPRDALRVSLVGLRTRTTRAVLSGLGITIGIASMVAVLGLSESSKSDLISTLDRLGTNLIVIEAAEGIGFGSGVLGSAAVMVDRISPGAVSAVGNVDAGCTDPISCRPGGASRCIPLTMTSSTLNGTSTSASFSTGRHRTTLVVARIHGRRAPGRRLVGNTGARVARRRWLVVASSIVGPLPIDRSFPPTTPPPYRVTACLAPYGAGGALTSTRASVHGHRESENPDQCRPPPPMP
jgi:hypothetical protein